jgi:5-hydroxyisourate hydrolase
MGGITTHVLDVSVGRPAAGIFVRLERKTEADWIEIGAQKTDDDGRARELFAESGELASGIHRLTFQVREYFKDKQVDSFYEEVTITFVISEASQHYHVPLLLSPFGYSTYRGS